MMIDFPLLRPDDAAHYLGMTVNQFRRARKSVTPPPAYRLGKGKFARFRYSRAQLDRWQLHADTYGLQPPVEPVAEMDTDAIACRADVERLLNILPQRERRIIELRYGFHDGRPWSYDEIGACDVFDMTRERVRQLEGQALERMRTVAGSRTPAPTFNLYPPSLKTGQIVVSTPKDVEDADRYVRTLNADNWIRLGLADPVNRKAYIDGLIMRDGFIRLTPSA